LAFVYDTTIDPNAENNSHAFALGMIGYNKSVLEVGCATGYFSKVLVERGCNVTGIEIDADAAAIAEKWLEKVFVGNLDVDDVWFDIEDESFDAVVFGDVLEHLRDPLSALRAAARKVKPSGVVVTSVPNIAHGDIRMSLLTGSFTYRDTGLLDRTHVRFFTLETLRDLMRDAGLVVVETQRVIMPLFHSEMNVNRNDIPHPECESYQFVMKSVRDNGTRTLSELASRVTELSDQVHHEGVRTALLRGGRLENVDEMLLLIEALKGHVSGLEHNIEVLDHALTASELRYQAVLNMKSVQLTAPFRWLYRKLRRIDSTPTPKVTDQGG
jgi:2-polyprenyl-3-methyl-5-hydroxy-6-metoxy-1,4-benzoquinol methylase